MEGLTARMPLASSLATISDPIWSISCPGPMEFEVGDRPRRPAKRLARHAHDVADQHLRPGIVAQDLVALRIDARAAEFDETDVVCATLKGELA
jgi:hypothetical protein